jgi:PTS system mannose-specific IID component
MIRRLAVFKVFASSFFIQASWSYEKMQGLGFAAAISPALREVFGDGASFRDALKRHLVFYNAHPYMASAVLGASIRLEERAKSGGCGAEAASAFKKTVMGPYGAIGDSFFWASVRPLASCAGALAAVLFGAWGVALFLAVYNAFHLWMRWRGLTQGLRLGDGVAGYVRSLGLPDMGLKLRYAAAAALGAFSSIAALRALAGFGAASPGVPRPAAWAAIVLVAAAVLYMLSRRGATVERLLYVVLLPLILYGIFR